MSGNTGPTRRVQPSLPGSAGEGSTGGGETPALPELTVRQAVVLEILATRGEALTLVELHATVGTRYSAFVLRTLTALLRKGYVTGSLDTAWSITDAGRAAWQHAPRREA